MADMSKVRMKRQKKPTGASATLPMPIGFMILKMNEDET
jgi:hypothetical protein